MKPGRLNVCIVFVFGCCAAVVPALAADPTSKFDPKIMQGRPIGDWFKQASDKDQATRDKATEVILQCLTNRDQAFRSNLHSWLCGNAAVGMPVVIKGLDHEDSEIRDESAYVLGHMPYSAATILPILRAKFKSAELLNRLALAEAILYLSPPS
ncbi:MAG TPA: hypothetical protein VGY66_27425, partial [Gemmataceae bacterium]|nr:hypothetical protein [Gemmataceae bacterium]